MILLVVKRRRPLHTAQSCKDLVALDHAATDHAALDHALLDHATLDRAPLDHIALDPAALFACEPRKPRSKAHPSSPAQTTCFAPGSRSSPRSTRILREIVGPVEAVVNRAHACLAIRGAILQGLW
jgi:hypothetical protein